MVTSELYPETIGKCPSQKLPSANPRFTFNVVLFKIFLPSYLHCCSMQFIFQLVQSNITSIHAYAWGPTHFIITYIQILVEDEVNQPLFTTLATVQRIHSAFLSWHLYGFSLLLCSVTTILRQSNNGRGSVIKER